MLYVPYGAMAVTDDEAAAAQRRLIAERLRNGQDVTIGAGGVAQNPDAPGHHTVPGQVELVVPTGKLA